MKKYILITLLCMCCNLPVLAFAATTTGQVNVTTTLFTASASLQASTYLQFPSSLQMAATKSAASTLQATVTAGVPYTITIDRGRNTFATTGNVRRMRNTTAAAYLSYALFQNAAHSVPWNINQNIARTGTGVRQTFNLYGRTTVTSVTPLGAYTDTLRITLTY